LLSIIAPGKEAVVFTATTADKRTVAVKIYRLETANFSKMFDYLRVDPRLPKLGKNTVGDPRRRTIFSWNEREYRNLLLAREAGLRAPMPIAYDHNVLVMEFVGEGEIAAPLLKKQTPDDMEAFAKDCIDQIIRFAKAGMVHGDLSEYNILNHNEEAWIIDFSHSVPLKASNSEELLKRDIMNVCAYFRKHGVACDNDAIFAECMKKETEEE
jgi:RIO kinase 1